MSNEAEHEAFEAWCDDQCFHAQTEGRAAFQAGAAYQREQDKKPAVKEWKCRHSAGEKWFLSDRPGYWECVPLYAAPVAKQEVVSVRMPAEICRELIALRDLATATAVYFNGYMLDEVDDAENCASVKHHEAALDVSYALDDLARLNGGKPNE